MSSILTSSTSVVARVPSPVPMPPDERTPNIGDAALLARGERERREAAALRENLRRRKAQSRARATAAEPPAPAPDTEEGADPCR